MDIRIMQYTFSGKVVRGDGYGRKIGFPTLNIDRRSFSKLKNKPKLGVYAGNVLLNSKKYRAGIVVGPIDKKRLPRLEAHLLSYAGDAYGEKVIYEINKFIRSFKSFKTEKELIEQIKKDIKICSQE